MKVETLFVHANFDPTAFVNDIALVKLGSPVNVYTQFIRPVCRPNSTDSYDGMICTITGWGASHTGKYRYIYLIEIGYLMNDYII